MSEKLILHYDVHDPIDAAAFGKALASVEKLYKKYLKAENQGSKLSDSECKLFITEIKNNCILCDLSPAVINALPTMEYIVNIGAGMIEFIKFFIYLKTVYSSTDSEEKQNELMESIPNSSLSNASNVISALPLDKSIKGSLNIVYEKETSDGAKESMYINYSSSEATKTRTGINRTLGYRRQRKNEYLNGVELRLVQFNTEVDCTKENAHSNDKGCIKKLSARALDIIWGTESMATSIKFQHTNPTQRLYNVDVHVRKDRHNNPVAYCILQVNSSRPIRNKRKGNGRDMFSK